MGFLWGTWLIIFCMEKRKVTGLWKNNKLERVTFSEECLNEFTAKIYSIKKIKIAETMQDNEVVVKRQEVIKDETAA